MSSDVDPTEPPRGGWLDDNYRHQMVMDGDWGNDRRPIPGQ